MMDRIEFHFKDLSTGEETIRVYEVPTFDDAISQFHDEFPKEGERPRIFQIKVEHLKQKVV